MAYSRESGQRGLGEGGHTVHGCGYLQSPCQGPASEETGIRSSESPKFLLRLLPVGDRALSFDTNNHELHRKAEACITFCLLTMPERVPDRPRLICCLCLYIVAIFIAIAIIDGACFYITTLFFLSLRPLPKTACTTFRRSIHELREWRRNGCAGQAFPFAGRQASEEKAKK